MKLKTIFTLALIAVLAVSFQTVMADEGCAGAKTTEKPVEQMMLKYKVKGLDKDMALEMTKVLGQDKNLVSAKPDYESEILTVVVDGTADIKKLTESLQTKFKDVELMSHGPTTVDAKSKCGGCPMQSKCKSQKDAGKPVGKKLTTTDKKPDSATEMTQN